MRIVMFGPPGSGKGTQGVRVAKQLGVPHVSTGDILREARASATELGRRAAHHMDRGDLVPDDVMVGIVAERVDAPDCARGFVLDGFPRTIPQAEALQETLKRKGQLLQHVVSLTVPREEIVRRLAGRKTCGSCGRPWAANDPETKAGRCACGGSLTTREDDRPESVERRMDVYTAQTEPLCAWYRERGLLREVDGTGGVEAVAARISAALARDATS